MHEKHIPAVLKKVLYILAAAIATFLLVKYIIPWLLPFIFSFLAAAALEPVILFLNRKFRIKRGFASAFTVTLTLALLFCCVFLTGERLITAAGDFLHVLPKKLVGFSLPIGTVGAHIDAFIRSLPEEFSDICLKALESIRNDASLLPSKLYTKLFAVVSATAAKMPQIIFFSLMFALSLYFISSGYPSVKAFIVRQLPLRISMKMHTVKQDVFDTLMKWLKAQLSLMGITFLELAAAFLVMRLKFALLTAAAVALIDALPIFGVGTILIPWAIISILFGEYRKALALIIIYAVVSLVRSCLEPKLLGSQTGLHPVATLIAVYAGYLISGISGMIIFPIILMLLKQFNDRGWITLWK